MEKEITLVIMAAGIGSRFGQKIKQLEPVGPNGELIIDYSVYDAVRAGFNHIVFVIRKDIEQLVREKIGDRLSKHVRISYAFQEKTDIPVRKELGEIRKKPWGTGQAVLSAKDIVKGPFAVINADDFYGAEAYRIIYDYLNSADNSGKAVPEYAMCGFKIKNTLSDNGTVTRGICTVENGLLKGLEETKEIRRQENGVITGVYNGETKEITDEAAASMNMWCFTGGYMDTLSEQFVQFLSKVDESNVDSGEFLVPIAVDELLAAEKCSVRVLPTDSKWFGMTYAEDVEAVKASLREYVDKGVYAEKLWD
ncbi:MAG: nucleotidyltransferase [Ruminiclostridium sp.]|nr:nucleotidyltransferase [Ruminiclostridium sp.]